MAKVTTQRSERRPRRKRLFDVRFYATSRVVRVRAESEIDAADVAGEVIKDGPYKWSAKPADGRIERKVYEWKESCGVAPIAPRKRGRK